MNVLGKDLTQTEDFKILKILKWSAKDPKNNTLVPSHIFIGIKLCLRVKDVLSVETNFAGSSYE